MIVVDTSALAAIVFGEPGAEQFVDALDGPDEVAVGAPTLLEASIVVTARHGEDGLRDLTLLVEHAGLRIHPFDAEQASRAHDAWRRFGKGRHPAALNFGDCLAYATAASLDCALLFKGDDFPRTDIRQVRLEG